VSDTALDTGAEPSAVRLRAYTDDDADAVLALNQSNLDGVGPLDPDRQRWLVSMADDVLVADDSGTLAGFAFVFGPRTDYDSTNYRWFVERMDDFGYLDRIVVAPTHRRRGIAGMLYDTAEAVSRHRGRLACEVYVEPPNTASLAFHAARGYREVGRLLQANGKTCTMLAKELAQPAGPT
jgi:predicted GNAT superfamily acetyltransferase